MNKDWFKDIKTNKWVHITKIQENGIEKIYIDGSLKYEREL